MKPTIKTWGLIEIHLAVFLFGISGLFAKLLTLNSLIIVLGRTSFAAIVLAFVLWKTQQSFFLQKKGDLAIFAVLGSLLAIHWATFFYSIQISTVAVGLLAYSSFPLFVTFMEPYFFKERLRWSGIFMAILVTTGLILVTPSFDIHNNLTQGVFWGMVSAFSFAILSLLNRKYVQQYSAHQVAFYQSTFAMLSLIPFLPFHELEMVTPKDFGLLIVLGVVFTAGAHSLFIQALATIKVQTASVISALEPIYAVFFAFFLFQETPTLPMLLGGALILGATLLASLSSVKPKEN